MLAVAVASGGNGWRATIAGTGRLIAAPADAKKEIQAATGVEPLRIRTGNRDRQRARGADWMSTAMIRRRHEMSGTNHAVRRFKNQRGAALLETAITIPLILLVSVAIFEFGRAYQTWQVLTNAAREGARIAVSARLHRRAGHEHRAQLHDERPAVERQRRAAIIVVPQRTVRADHRVAHHGELSVQFHGAQSGRAARSKRIRPWARRSRCSRPR